MTIRKRNPVRYKWVLILQNADEMDVGYMYVDDKVYPNEKECSWAYKKFLNQKTEHTGKLKSIYGIRLLYGTYEWLV